MKRGVSAESPRVSRSRLTAAFKPCSKIDESIGRPEMSAQVVARHELSRPLQEKRENSKGFFGEKTADGHPSSAHPSANPARKPRTGRLTRPTDHSRPSQVLTIVRTRRTFARGRHVGATRFGRHVTGKNAAPRRARGRTATNQGWFHLVCCVHTVDGTRYIKAGETQHVRGTVH